MFLGTLGEFLLSIYRRGVLIFEESLDSKAGDIALLLHPFTHIAAFKEPGNEGLLTAQCSICRAAIVTLSIA